MLGTVLNTVFCAEMKFKVKKKPHCVINQPTDIEYLSQKIVYKYLCFFGDGCSSLDVRIEDCDFDVG